MRRELRQIDPELIYTLQEAADFLRSLMLMS